MKLYLFSVYDKVSKMYVDLFTSQTRESAQRSFNSAALNRGTMLAKFPSDFALYCLGEFDNSTGEVVGLAVPELVQNSVEIVSLPDLTREEVKEMGEGNEGKEGF